jgi:polynucleotide 5'-kinase involved in rRNA processing
MFIYHIRKRITLEDFAKLSLREARKVMVIGALDTGKTSMCRKLMSYYLRAQRKGICFLDLDVGQSTVGPPCTIGIKRVNSKEDLSDLQRSSVEHLAFIGSLYPYGHERKVYQCLNRLLKSIPSNRTVIVDTTGYKEAGNKTIVFKRKKIMIIKPDIVLFLSQRPEREDRILRMLDIITRKVGAKLLILPPQNNFGSKSIELRRKRHQLAFSYWLSKARDIRVPIKSLASYNELVVTPNQYGNLVGLLDENGFCVGGGILQGFRNDTLIVYGRKRPGGTITSIDISEQKFKMGSWKIIHNI